MKLGLRPLYNEAADEEPYCLKIHEVVAFHVSLKQPVVVVVANFDILKHCLLLGVEIVEFSVVI